MQCLKCGREAPAESVFCPHCGAQIGDGADLVDDDGSSGPQLVKAANRGRGAAPPEEELWSGSYSAKAMAGSFLAAAILTVLGMILATFGGPLGWVVFVVGAVVVWGGLVLLYHE